MPEPGNSVDAAPNSEPLAYRAVRGGLWVMLGSYWSIGFGFLANVALARLLSPEIYGLAGLGGFFAQILRVSPRVNLGYAFIQHKENSSEALGTYFAAEGIVIVTGVALTLLAAPLLLWLGYAEPVVVLSIVFALAGATEGVMGIGLTLLEKELLFERTSLVMSLTATISYLPAFWMAMHGGGVWSLVAQNITYNALLVIAIWWLVRRSLPQIWHTPLRFSSTLARQFFRFGLAVGIGGWAGLLVTNLDQFLVGTFAGVAALGLYARAYNLAQWPSTLLSSLIVRTAFNTYAQLQNDRTRLQKTVTMMLWGLTIAALPIALILFITAPDLIVFLYTEQWLPSAPYLRILVLITLARLFWENARTFLVAIGEPKLPAVVNWIQVAVLVGIGTPLTIVWGTIGACVAVGLTFAVGLAPLGRSMRSFVSIPFGSLFGIPTLAGALTIVGYVIFNRLVPLNDLPLALRLGVKILYTLGTFSFLAFCLQPHVTRARVAYVWQLFKRNPGQSQ